MKTKKLLVLLVVMVAAISACAGLSVINTQKLTKEFCVISKNDLLCYKREPGKNAEVINKYSGVCKDYDGWVMIPMETFQRITQ